MVVNRVAPYSLTIKELARKDCQFCKGSADYELENPTVESKRFSLCKGCCNILHKLLDVNLKEFVRSGE